MNTRLKLAHVSYNAGVLCAETQQIKAKLLCPNNIHTWQVLNVYAFFAMLICGQTASLNITNINKYIHDVF